MLDTYEGDARAQHISEGTASCLRLDDIFQSHMVLPCGRSIPLTGQAVPGQVVTISLDGRRWRSFASGDGRFTVQLPPMEPADSLTLTAACGGEQLTLSDVAVGHVYLASGQSNMEFHLADAKPGPESLTEEDYGRIRYLQVPRATFYGRQRHFGAGAAWRRVTRADAGGLSAVAVFFACDLARKSGVTVGVVEAAVGGSPVEAWLTREALQNIDGYREKLLDYERAVCDEAAVCDKFPDGNQKLTDGLARMFPQLPEDEGVAKGYASPGYDDGAWGTMRLPDTWTQAGHNHAGVFWFRRKIELSAGWEKAAAIHLGAIDKGDRVYVNGQLVGATGDGLDMAPWNLLRVYPVPAGLLHAGENTIAVRACSLVSICADGGLIGPEEEMYLEGEGGRVPLSGLWRFHETFDAGTAGMTFMYTLGPGITASLHILYDNMIAPMEGFPFTGVLWYQGEANSICTAARYREMLTALVADWRRAFGVPDLPFIVVQLPDYHNPHYFAPFAQWPRIREAQLQAARDTDGACIVTIGYGDVFDLHPVHKRPVAEAAATAALASLRGEPFDNGPVLRDMRRDGDALELVFDGAPLAASDGGMAPRGFVLGDAEGHCFAATAAIVGPHTLRLRAEGVATPEAVWYAWAENPREATLRDVNGLPASPFRAALDGSAPVGRNLIH